MRITYIHQHFKLPHQAGGTRSWEFARRLAADGHKVTIIAGNADWGHYDLAGVHIRYVKAPYSNRMTVAARVESFLGFVVRATVEACRVPADVVFATSTPLTVAIPGILAARLRRARFVFEVRDLWPSVPARLGILRSRVGLRAAQLLERSAYRADRVIALSPAMREGVLQTAPFADVRVVPNACDHEVFDLPRERREEIRSQLGWGSEPVAIYAGSFGATYRIPWMVELAAHCPTVRFQIIGEGAATEESRALAENLELDVDALLPGSLPKEEVARRVAAADVVISSLSNHPALHANSLNKVFDALAAGRGVAFNHDGWLADLLVARGAGWRLPDSPAEAAAVLGDLAGKRHELERFGLAARELGYREFDRDALYAEFREALLG